VLYRIIAGNATEILVHGGKKDVVFGGGWLSRLEGVLRTKNQRQ